MLKKIGEWTGGIFGVSPQHRFTVDHLRYLSMTHHFPCCIMATMLCLNPCSPKGIALSRNTESFVLSDLSCVSDMDAKWFASWQSLFLWFWKLLLWLQYLFLVLKFAVVCLLISPVSVLEKNPLVTTGNSDMMVETVREISELVTWGDKHSTAITECFLERWVRVSALHMSWLNCVCKRPCAFVCSSQQTHAWCGRRVLEMMLCYLEPARRTTKPVKVTLPNNICFTARISCG